MVNKYQAEIVGVVAGGVTFAGCMVGTAGAGSVGCAAAAGAVGGAVTNLWKSKVQHTQAFSWNSLAADTVVGGVLGAAGGVIGKAVAPIAKTLAASVSNSVRTATARAGGAVASAARKAGDAVKTVAKRATNAARSGGGKAAAATGDAANTARAGADDVLNGVRLRAQLTGEEISGGHAFQKHVLDRAEFPGIRTRPQFASHVEDVVLRGEMRTLSGGANRLLAERDGSDSQPKGCRRRHCVPDHDRIRLLPERTPLRSVT
ncbi:hypothetical protein [Cellulomonas gelida]|uniref:Uncharacterized protein n=1 Tax=Cellulomonas gelida TaxID=1712 RepID=A0A4Y3KQ49_9CELL|nr:hypothetical protein [Cellulomonas gelida]GEA85080.1 hypothetical protein CGE01nite_23310 [Cellulomonas gelida]GGL16254.1 hypothetical protein GCM10009774_03330 [Cellulomonas gelida]